MKRLDMDRLSNVLMPSYAAVWFESLENGLGVGLRHNSSQLSDVVVSSPRATVPGRG